MTTEIIIDTIPTQTGTIGHIILNRPQALNALSLNILETMARELGAWRDDDDIAAVLIEGAGDRAFCAGGDIRAVYYHRDEVIAGEQPYFEIEYHLNELIFNFPKPYIAILDGIAMGGGLGISIWGSHPIATERLHLAMPETAIGLFPDIGASYFLTKLPHHIGYYLGLTGHSINAYEALKLGLVKTVIKHSSVAHYIKQLDPLNVETPEPINLPTASTLFDHANDIERCFSKPTITDILNALETGNGWCQETAELLKKRSPLSLKVTLAYLQRSQGKSFTEVMQLNSILVNNFLRNDEFYEGIRAAVIDKDKNPQWQHSIEEVEKIAIEPFFVSYSQST